MIKAPAISTVHAVFEPAFKEFGLPHTIRTDNGTPFASPQALFGLSKLSVWWLKLGINIERIKLCNPQQNGRHERMHLTLTKAATKPPGFNFLRQQEMFDRFIKVYNHQRPHQGIEGAYTGELYTPSKNIYQPPCPSPLNLSHKFSKTLQRNGGFHGSEAVQRRRYITSFT